MPRALSPLSADKVDKSIKASLAEERARTRTGYRAETSQQTKEPEGDTEKITDPRKKAAKEKAAKEKAAVEAAAAAKKTAEAKAAAEAASKAKKEAEKAEKKRAEEEKKKAEALRAQQEALNDRGASDTDFDDLMGNESSEEEEYEIPEPRNNPYGRAARTAEPTYNIPRVVRQAPRETTPPAKSRKRARDPVEEISSSDEEVTVNIPPPLRRPAAMTQGKALVAKLRADCPQFQDYPDAWLEQQTIGEVAKAMHISKKVGDKLQLDEKHEENTQKARDKPVLVPEGYDDRHEQLHPGRYLPGAAVPLSDHWLNYRTAWSKKGVDAIADYDVKAMGMTGCVTARGWDVLHHPGDKTISIKLFSVSNAIHQATGSRTMSMLGDDGFQVTENWKALSDMAALKQALKNLIRAAHLVRPLDYSFLVLECFLTNTSYLDEDTKGYNKAPVVSDFIDTILKLNATQFVNAKPFMSLSDMEATWKSFWGNRRPQCAKEEKKEADNGSKGGNNPQQNSGKKAQGNSNNNEKGGGGQDGKVKFQIPALPQPIAEGNICRFYNKGSCRNTHENCVRRNKNGQLFRLHHRCNHMIKSTDGTPDKLCKGIHAACDEH